MPSTGGEVGSIGIGDGMDNGPQLDIRGVKACITFIMQATPGGYNREISTVHDAFVDEGPDTLVEMIHLDEVTHHLRKGLNKSAELERAASSSAPDLLVMVME
jgi:hypothetical protein